MTLRTKSFFKIIDWRLIITPVALITRFYRENQDGKLVEIGYKDIYIFGIRIARIQYA